MQPSLRSAIARDGRHNTRNLPVCGCELSSCAAEFRGRGPGFAVLWQRIVLIREYLPKNRL